MTITALDPVEVMTTSVHALGLDNQRFTLDSPEALAASIRRAASFLCPTSPRLLVDTVLEVITPVLTEPPEREDLMEMLEQMISTGDLIELAQAVGGRRARLLYLGPPTFVEIAAGHYLVSGVRPHSTPLLSSNFEITYTYHARTVSLDPATAEARLIAAGLHKVNRNKWAGLPSVLSAETYVEQFRDRLSVARSAGTVEGLSIIDPVTKPQYYRGRWRPPAPGDTGDYVGRRPQAFGANLWCFVRLADGAPRYLIDLPLDGGTTPARDDAWRLQAAIDAVNLRPSCFRILPMPNASTPERVVAFFSPLPSWTERYLQLIGSPTDKSDGALFSYSVPDSALGELRLVLSKNLWMSELVEGES